MSPCYPAPMSGTPAGQAVRHASKERRRQGPQRLVRVALVAGLALAAAAAPAAPARQSLAGLLWGGHSEAAALASLRQALSLIGKCCGRPVISSAGRSVALAVQHFDIDIHRFDAADGSARALQLAVSQYRGELLHGMDIGEAAFDDWLQCQRRRLHERALQLCRAWFAASGDAADGDAALVRVDLAAPVPEPGSLACAVLALGALAGRGRRRSQEAQPAPR